MSDPVVLEHPDSKGVYTALNADQAEFWQERGWKPASKKAVKELEDTAAVPAPGSGTAKEK